ncbi:MAG: hypothetical protein D4R88_06860 [Methanosarcinales archaeon]|nr:MAG: hypothetical protein D4R88_06860 [Methanosarcinales archaeon]
MRKMILIAAVVLSLLLAGCITEEKKQQEVKFFTDITTMLGDAGNGTQFQKLNWRVNISNIGGKTAENTRARIILHPEIVSRMNGSDIDQVDIGNMPPSIVVMGFNGSVTFNSTGLSKQDIASWEPLLKVKIIWIEDGSEREQVINAG